MVGVLRMISNPQQLSPTSHIPETECHLLKGEKKKKIREGKKRTILLPVGTCI